MRVAVVVPVFRNAPTLGPLVERLHAVLDDNHPAWSVRLVVDACPEGSEQVASELAGRDPHVRITPLRDNVGQHRAIVSGLRAEPHADAWVCMDADLQDPPEALPALLTALQADGIHGVFAGRRGGYESAGRRLTGELHRRVLSALTGLPRDAGAFLAMRPCLRDAVIDGVGRRGAPSVVLAATDPRCRTISVPVERAPRPVGSSSWTSTARLSQSARTLGWAARSRRAQSKSASQAGPSHPPRRPYTALER